LFSVLSTENNKAINLSVLCDSNERSEWAVNYCIKAEAISSRSRLQTTIFYMKSKYYMIINNLKRTAVIYLTTLFFKQLYGSPSLHIEKKNLMFNKLLFSKISPGMIFIMSLTLMTRKALEAKGWKVEDNVGEKLTKK
jgi:hypothetical protein